MSSTHSSPLSLFNGILPENTCIVLVKTEWNAEVVDALEAGCRRVLAQSNIEHIETVLVPGAVEIPFAVKAYWEAHHEKAVYPHAFIALGCVVRGDTPHFEYVCQAVTNGVGDLNLQLPVPVIFGVLTVNTNEQAQERISGKHGHKGEEAAVTALKMISLQLQFNRS
ncbi:MAG TPA: 6,7-dimethyl-8-ribityllumazine synthase [Flavihumibacter sp.]|nr:6,7-dimethyl-8-ribityllumazine synthase [Flavihumibacter sp.]